MKTFATIVLSILFFAPLGIAILIWEWENQFWFNVFSLLMYYSAFTIVCCATKENTMKPILFIPIGIFLLFILWAWMVILLVPLLLLYAVTQRDFSRSWMVKWAEKPLMYCLGEKFRMY